MTSRHELTAPESASGCRIDRVLADILPDLTRTAAARLLAEGHVAVDGRTAQASQRLRGGERIVCEVPDAAPATAEPEDLPLRILLEDEHLIVVDKPAGLVVHPGAGAPGGTLVNALLHHCGSSLRGIGGELRPGIVHRLDKGNSGVIVVAKTASAHAALSAQFADRSVGKTYFAVVTGTPPLTGTIDAPIGRSTAVRTRMAVGAPRGRPSLTTWRRTEIFGRSAASLDVRLRTGRTHQARVHLAHAGHPIVGDATYGHPGWRAPDARMRPVLAAFGRPALHARVLAFTHPASGERVELEAPIPADLVALVEALRAISAS